MNLKNKNIIITGASKGIGKSITEEFILQGANVIINYKSYKSSAEKLEDFAYKNGVKVLIVQADITNPKEIEIMFNKITKKFPRIDVLVNNAGIFNEKDSPKNLEVFKSIFETNFLSHIRITNETLKYMEKGKIIFISSIHGQLGQGRPDAIAYSSMKAALNSYMKNLAKYLAPKILVNAVAPGQTLTP